MATPLTLCLIPSRTGSQRITGKNFRPLVGLSPLERAIGCCQLLRILHDTQIIVTSDGEPTFTGAVLWHQVGAPLHTDECSMVDVVTDVLMHYPSDPEQRVLLVQPTQPLRTVEHLEHALRLLETHPSVVSMVETTSADKAYYISPWHTLEPLGRGVERDQDSERTYACDGTVYGFHRGWFLRHRQFRHHDQTYPLLIPQADTCRLDTPHDWLVASLLLAHRGTKANHERTPLPSLDPELIEPLGRDCSVGTGTVAHGRCEAASGNDRGGSLYPPHQ